MDEFSSAMTTDGDITSLIIDAVKKYLKDAGALGEVLMMAFKLAEFLQNISKIIFENHEMTGNIFSIAKYIFKSGWNLLKYFGIVNDIVARAAADFNADDYVVERGRTIDVEVIYSAIKDAGITQDVFDNALADPQACTLFLANVFKQGLVDGENIYDWVKSSGVLEKSLTWMGFNGDAYAPEIAKFVGGLITSGEASVSDVDNAAPLLGFSSGASTPMADAGASSSFASKRSYY